MVQCPDVLVFAYNTGGGVGRHTELTMRLLHESGVPAQFVDLSAGHGTHRIRRILDALRSLGHTGARRLLRRPVIAIVAKGDPTEGGLWEMLLLRLSALVVVFQHGAPRTNLPPLRLTNGRPRFALHRRIPLASHRFKNRLPHLVLVPSAEAREILVEQWNYRNATTHAGILTTDTQRFRPHVRVSRQDLPVLLGFVARPDVITKGIDLLLDAVVQLAADTEIPFRLRVVGFDAADLAPHLPVEILQRAAAHIEFLGPVSDDDELCRFYAGLDSLVISSRRESGPTVLLEAGACGTPVVTYRLGLAKELVEDGRTGWVAGREGEATSLAAAMKRCVETPPTVRRSFGTELRERIVGRFDDAGFGRQLAELVRSR